MRCRTFSSGRLLGPPALCALLAGALALLLAALPAEAAAPVRRVATNGEHVQMQVVVSRAVTLASDAKISEILVGNPDIADVVALTDRSLYVLGKKIGITSVSVLNEQKRVLAVVTVEVTFDIDGLRNSLSAHVPGAGISVASINGKVLLTGTLRDTATLSRALAIAEQFAPGAVTNGLAVRGSQQVLLEVRFIEASRDSSRDLGIAWDAVGKKFSAATGLAAASNNIPFGAAVATLLDNGTRVDVLIQALEKRGLARRLAEPNLVALSGDTANFLAGGEFPFPVQNTAVGGTNLITVEFKKFGVGLAFTPTVLGDGLINLKIEPEVSELDPTQTLTISGVQIPSLSVRRARTTIELRDGQSFAMAGLLQSAHINNQAELPWVGQVPVLGTLLRSAAFQKKETDLVIIVTPRLIQPRRPGDAPLATPLDGKVPANDREFFIGGRTEIKVGKPDPLRGHILDLVAENPTADLKKGAK
ncbi:MAG: type II and III secretion system protein family protein [Hyphomicrobiaceae bacterium]|nr:type II and III secretion system protein family protein [Hyphomicrobiaceae bacterium]